nr:hypothetical protein [Tanacetum cinerariifolium]
IMEQMTQLTSMCEMFCQIVQKKQEEQAASARYWKIPACCDDDDDYDSAIIPILSTEEPVDSLSMGDEHLDIIPATESDEVMKSSVENPVPIPSEFEENIEYVEASPHDYELVSLEAAEIVIPKVEEIEDNNLRERKPRKGQNQIKTGQKREAWRSREKSKTVTVNKEGKTEQNAKRRARNANASKFKSRGQLCPMLKVVMHMDDS